MDVELLMNLEKASQQSREIEEKYAQSKKLAALGQISSGVAHDFNNVLTGVLGRVQLIKRQTEDPEYSKTSR